MKHLMYVLFAIACLCTTTFTKAQEIFVCTTSLPNNVCLNNLEEVVETPVYKPKETNMLEKCFLPITEDRRFAIYSIKGKHLVAQTPIEGQPSFVWKEGIPNEEEKWMIGGGILLSPLGTHFFVNDLTQTFAVDWERTFRSSEGKVAGNFPKK